jgi:FMN phosphatase YigB (HAD superfamily)
MIGTLIFDWGGTIMEDTGLPGPMYLWKEVALVPGALEALEALSGGFICLAATGAGISDGPMMKKAMERVGADRFFSGFFSPKETGFSKPDPRFFEEICRRTGILPGQCIMTGNDYLKDISGAKAAGMHTVFFNAGGLKGPFGHADFVITRMHDLPQAVGQIVTLYSERR